MGIGDSRDGIRPMSFLMRGGGKVLDLLGRFGGGVGGRRDCWIVGRYSLSKTFSTRGVYHVIIALFYVYLIISFCHMQ